MPIFSDTDFYKHRKTVKFKPWIKDPGPASQDLHIGKVFRAPKSCPETREDLEYELSMPAKDFIKKLEPLPLKGTGKDRFWLIEPKDYYIAVAAEHITLPEQFSVDVDSRSSWARHGLRVMHCDDAMNSHRRNYEGPILLNLTSQDKPILLRPKDRVCQAVVYDYLDFVQNKDIHALLKSGELKCYKKKNLADGDLIVDWWDIENHALCLTLNKNIKKFIGHRIDPKQDVSKFYTTIDVSGGYRVGKQRFFLGSSNETLYIGNGYVGILREIFSSPSFVRVHANAGYIDPGFEGTITLEQHIPDADSIEDVIFKNMQMGEVEIHKLMSPCTKPYKSKYSGQHGTTVSMAHLDYKR